MWAAIAMAYYGISLGVQELAGDIFANTILMGIMEVSAVTILMFTMDKSGFQKVEKNKIIISFQIEIALLFLPIFTIFNHKITVCKLQVEN